MTASVKRVALGALGTFLGGLSLWLISADPYSAHLVILWAMFATLASYWNLLDGYIGIINFGYAAFFGIGAYTSAILASDYSLLPPLAMVVAGIVSGCIGVAVMVPCLKMSGFTTGIVTLAFGEIVRIGICAMPKLTRGEMGFWGIAPLFSVGGQAPYLVAAVVLVLISIMMLRWIVRSPLGLAFTCIRDDEVAASCLGIDVNLYRLMASGISCFVAGVMGAFYAHYILTISPAICGIGYTVQVMAMSLVGGKGTLYGPAAGAALLLFLSEWLRFLEDYRLLIYGSLLIVIVMFVPGGLSGLSTARRPSVLVKKTQRTASSVAGNVTSK